jgi:hypothetical protein
MKTPLAKLLKDKAVERALNYISGKRFTIKLESRIYYHLDGIARLGRLTGLVKLGNHDWYKEGCEFLVTEQSNNGSWPARAGRAFDQWPVINTSFALLFLSK